MTDSNLDTIATGEYNIRTILSEGVYHLRITDTDGRNGSYQINASCETKYEFCSVSNGTLCNLYQTPTYEQDIYCCNYMLGKNGAESPQELHSYVKLVKDLNIASLVCDWAFFVIAACASTLCAICGEGENARHFGLAVTAFGIILDICITFSIVAVIDQLYAEQCYSPSLDSTLFDLSSQFESILLLDAVEGVIDIISLCILGCG